MSSTQQQHEEANDFAGALLMPEEEFRKKVEEGCTNVGDLAEFFQVPSMAVRHRARVLGMGGHLLYGPAKLKKPRKA